MALVPEEPPTRRRAAVLSGLSQVLMLGGRYEESEALARQAIAVAARIPDGRAVEGHARCNLGVDLAYTGRLEEGVAELREALRIAEEYSDDVDDIARALVNLSSILYDHGPLEEALKVALDSLPVIDNLGLQRGKGVWCRCSAAQVLMLLGRLSEAGELIDEARQLQPQGIEAFRTDLVEGQLWLRRGGIDQARRLMERAEAAGSKIIDPDLLVYLYATLVEIATWQGDDAAAARWSTDGLSRLDGVIHPAHVVPLLAAAATAAVRADPPRPADARELLERAGASLATAPAQGTTLAELAVRAAEAELSADSTQWQDMVRRWEGLGEPFRAAYAHLRLAEALLGSGADREEAAEHLRVATATARRIGAEGLLARAEDLGRRSRLNVETAPDNPYRLTAREVEVLRLLADGLSDREIGTRLFISHRTVERHVSNLLSKLGAARRAELVATALREGLLNADSSAG